LGGWLGDFEIDTRLEPSGESEFRATLSEDWAIWGPNGGYVAAIALRAVGLVSKVGRPATFAGHFLSVARFEEIDVRVTAVKIGRRSESFRVSISQNDRPVFEGLVRTADQAPGLEHDVSQMPDDPKPAELREIAELVPAGSSPPFPFWTTFRSSPSGRNDLIRWNESPIPRSSANGFDSSPGRPLMTHFSTRAARS